VSGKATKREQRRSERQLSSLWWNVIVLGTLGFTILMIVLYVILTQRPGPLPNEVIVPDEGLAVIAEGAPLPTYQTYPPSSGTHYDKPAPWGLALEPVSEGNYLNNLARGGVVVLYQCPAGCEELQQQFTALLEEAPKDNLFNQVKILISRNDRIPSLIVALAWGHQLDLQAFDEQTLLTWYRRFVNYGPRNGP
jgi:hypothetical protein